MTNTFFQFENLGRDIKIIFNHILGVEIEEVIHVNSGNGKSMKNKTINYLNQLSNDQKKKFYCPQLSTIVQKAPRLH